MGFNSGFKGLTEPVSIIISICGSKKLLHKQRKMQGQGIQDLWLCSAVVGENLQKITGLQHVTSLAAERRGTLSAYPQPPDLSPLIIQVKIT